MIDDSAINYIVDSGFDSEMGARPIKRTIERCIVDKLAQSLLFSVIDQNRPIMVSYTGTEIKFGN